MERELTPQQLASREKLHKAGMGIMEKRLIKNILKQLSHLALPMQCLPTDIIIEIGFNNEGKTLIGLANQKNIITMDFTAEAQEMKDENPLVEDVIGDILEIMREAAQFWETSTDNIVFRGWTLEGKLQCDIKPRTGFPDEEIIKLA